MSHCECPPARVQEDHDDEHQSNCVVSIRAERDAAVKRAEKTEAACAAMRDLLVDVQIVLEPEASDCDGMARHVRDGACALLDEGAGLGWEPPSRVSKLRTALEAWVKYFETDCDPECSCEYHQMIELSRKALEVKP